MWISLFLSRLMVQLFSCAFKLAFAVWARLALLACCKPYWVCSEFNNASYSAVKYLNVPQPCETSGNCSDYCSLKNVLFDFMKYYPVFVEISIEPKIQEDPADFCCSSSEYFSPLWFSDLTNPHCISLSKMLLSLLLPKNTPVSDWIPFRVLWFRNFIPGRKLGGWYRPASLLSFSQGASPVLSVVCCLKKGCFAYFLLFSGCILWESTSYMRNSSMGGSKNLLILTYI